MAEGFMRRVWLKGCLRCAGDAFLCRDQHGLFQECLQCGHFRDLDIPTEQGQFPKVQRVYFAQSEAARQRYSV